MAQSGEIKLLKRFDQNIEITGTLTVGGSEIDFSSFLTSFTETDPIFSASAAAGITSTNITNWNTAYGWGDHANAGYLTSFDITTQTDPKYLRSDTSDTMNGSLTVDALFVGNSTLENYIAFRGTVGDDQTLYTHTFIGEYKYGGTEQAELLLFKGNDPATSTGPDRIRYVGSTHVFQTYTTGLSGTFNAVASSTVPVTRLEINNDGSISVAGSLTAGSLIKSGGTSSQFLKADGSVDSSTYLTSVPSEYLTQTEGDTRYVNVASDTMTGDLNFNTTSTGVAWAMNTDGAYIKFINVSDADTNSRLEYATFDNGNEYHRFLISGVEKFQVNNFGINVTGSATASSFSTTGDITISNGQPKLKLKETDSTNVDKEILVSGGSFYIRNLNDNNTAGDNILSIDSSGNVAANSLSLSSTSPFIFTGVGGGTYDIGAMYVNTNGMTFESPLESDSGSAARRPVTLTWRGGYNAKGGLKLTGDTSLYTDNTGLGIDETSPIRKLHVNGTGVFSMPSNNKGGITFWMNSSAYLSLSATNSSHPSGWGWQFQDGYAEQDNPPDHRFGYRTNSFLNAQGGNVAIGSDTPDSKLHVHEASRTGPSVLTLSNNVISGDNGISISQIRTFIGKDDDELARIEVQNSSDSHDNGNIIFSTMDGYTDTFGSRMTINASNLSVETNTIRLGFAGTNSTLNIRRPSDGNDAGQIGYFSATNSDFGLRNGSGGGDIRFYSNNGTFRFYSGSNYGTQVLQVTSAGDATLTNNLTVNGAGTGINVDTGGHASVRLKRGSTSYDNNLLFYTSGTLDFRIWQDGSSDYLYIRDEDNGLNMVTFKRGGTVGINREPSYNLDVNGDVRIGTSTTSGELNFTTNNANYIHYSSVDCYWRVAGGSHYFEGGSGYKGRWTGSGDLGINENNPSEKLHVGGNIRQTGYQRSDNYQSQGDYGWHWHGVRYSTYLGDTRSKLYEYFYNNTAAPAAETYVDTYNLNSNAYMGENIWGDVHQYHSMFKTYIYVKRAFTVTNAQLNGDDPYAIWIDGTYVAGRDSCCTATPYTYTFTVGWHKIELIYSEGGGGHYVQMGWNPKDYTAYISAMNPHGPVDLYNLGGFSYRDGKLGIGVKDPSYNLDVNGTIKASGDVIAYSDVRLKENVNTISSALNKVNALRGVEFNKIGDTKKSIGVIAQEIEKVLPEVVSEDNDGMKAVAYGNIVSVLIEAVKELSNKVEELENKLHGTKL